MLIALSVYNNRIAPVFDVASQLKVIKVCDGEVVDETVFNLPIEKPLERAIKIHQLGVKLLICGAVSEEAKSFLDMYKIKTVAFIAGDIEEIISSWILKKFSAVDYSMPGCRNRKQMNCKQRIRKRCRMNRNNFNI